MHSLRESTPVEEINVQSGATEPEPLLPDEQRLCHRFQEAVATLESTDAPIYVDIQYLLTINGGYVMKEFCAECDGYPAAWTTVKSPNDEIPDTEANSYNENYVNGLNWEDGVMWPAQLRSATSTLFSGHRRVFVKGFSKIDILVSVLDIPRTNITELFNMPSLRVMRDYVILTDSCPLHKHQRGGLACAKWHTRSIIVQMGIIFASSLAINIEETICRQFQEAVKTLQSTDAPVYVDILYLLTIEGGRVLKEFCAECEGYPAAWTTVKSPQDDVPDKKANRYGERRIHGLKWGDGVMWPEQLRCRTRTLFGGRRRVIVKGKYQAQILVRVLGISQTNITQLPNMPRVRDLRRSVTHSEACPFHEYRKKIFACAKKHTRTMILYMGNSMDREPLQSISGNDLGVCSKG